MSEADGEDLGGRGREEWPSEHLEVVSSSHSHPAPSAGA